jgi:hypothetical protein
MRILFVTAADESFSPLLRGLVQSLQQWQPLPYTALGCFDLGLSPDTRSWIEQHAKHVVAPGWDLPVSERLKSREPHARALTVRPFLRDYFPGYDIYLWLDADSWVQERYALDWYLRSAARGALAITPQVHHAYRHTQASFAWRMQRMQAYFGQPGAQRLSWATYFNAGVFALPANAPHWTRWQKAFETGLEAADGDICCDQTALNYMLWTEDTPVAPMPALCNWLCHLAIPGYDTKRKRFCEPVAPGAALGILHMAANTKNMRIRIRDEGVLKDIGLGFPGLVIAES